MAQNHALRAPAARGELAATSGIAVLLGACVLFPLGLLLWRSLSRGGELTWRNYVVVLSSPTNFSALAYTIVVGTLVAAVCVAAGATLAWLVTRTDVPGRGLWRVVFTVPLAFPPVIGAIAWIQLLNARVGHVNRLLQGPLGLERGPFDVNSVWGLVWVLSLFWYAVVYLNTSAALQRMDTGLEEAARVSGAGPFRLLWDVTLPLVAPTLIASALLVFVGVAASFSIAALIGPPVGIHLLSTRIVSTLEAGGPNAAGEASAMSAALMALGLLSLALSRRATRRGRHVLVGGKATAGGPVGLGAWRIPAAAALAAAALVVVALPLGSMAFTSLVRGARLDAGWEGITLANYRYVLLEHHATVPGLRNGLLLAAVSATAGTVVGGLLAYLRTRGRPMAGLLDGLATLSNATPPTVIALGLLLAFSGRYGVSLYDTFALLVIAYVVKDLALGVRAIGGAVQQVDASLEEAARVSGAGWWRALLDVVAPLVRPAVVVAWFTTFLTAFREVNMTILLFGPRTPTAGVALFELQNGGYYQSAAAFSMVMLALALAVSAVIRWVTRGAVAA